ncbi:triose-phosphate isomerase [Riemerella columbipharyngis]|uniref:Triosephosphate isomerase n=1 Tax=Riemerella columbipharyngis TaxID=1071918 RepID=A0A1G6ZLD1_9FLAO|nr:triose-phosphate isomerase [Riemerella columbipharyngis]SDE03067.1 triosephosphate isomerase (TIM) [Riemerella columbipharyngis]
MRSKIVAGNWKMNKTYLEAKKLMEELLAYSKSNKPNCKVMIAPPSLYLAMGKNIFDNGEVEVYAQDLSTHDAGAYTGEISVDMLLSLKANGSIVAHSERRQYHNETDESAAVKVKKLLEKGLTPIYCNGEKLEERKAGEYLDVIKKQTETALFDLSAEDIKKVVIAYEPVWAIGTGETATAEQAQEVHAFIRNLIADKYGKEVADEISILYGGSVKPNNAKEIFSQPDVDGGLIGGAALNVEDFTKIIEAFS